MKKRLEPDECICNTKCNTTALKPLSLQRRVWDSNPSEGKISNPCSCAENVDFPAVSWIFNDTSDNRKDMANISFLVHMQH